MAGREYADYVEKPRSGYNSWNHDDAWQDEEEWVQDEENKETEDKKPDENNKEEAGDKPKEEPTPDSERWKFMNLAQIMQDLGSSADLASVRKQFANANPEHKGKTSDLWIKSCILRGWRPGDAVPSFGEIIVSEAESGEPLIEAPSGSIAWNYAIKVLKIQEFSGYYYKNKSTGKVSHIQYIAGSKETVFNKKHNQDKDYRQMCRDLFSASFDKILYDKALAEGKIGEAFAALVKSAQEVLFYDRPTGAADGMAGDYTWLSLEKWKKETTGKDAAAEMLTRRFAKQKLELDTQKAEHETQERQKFEAKQYDFFKFQQLPSESTQDAALRSVSHPEVRAYIESTKMPGGGERFVFEEGLKHELEQMGTAKEIAMQLAQKYPQGNETPREAAQKIMQRYNLAREQALDIQKTQQLRQMDGTPLQKAETYYRALADRLAPRLKKTGHYQAGKKAGEQKTFFEEWIFAWYQLITLPEKNQAAGQKLPGDVATNMEHFFTTFNQYLEDINIYKYVDNQAPVKLQGLKATYEQGRMKRHALYAAWKKNQDFKSAFKLFDYETANYLEYAVKSVAPQTSEEKKQEESGYNQTQAYRQADVIREQAAAEGNTLWEIKAIMYNEDQAAREISYNPASGTVQAGQPLELFLEKKKEGGFKLRVPGTSPDDSYEIEENTFDKCMEVLATSGEILPDGMLHYHDPFKQQQRRLKIEGGTSWSTVLGVASLLLAVAATIATGGAAAVLIGLSIAASVGASGFAIYEQARVGKLSSKSLALESLSIAASLVPVVGKLGLLGRLSKTSTLLGKTANLVSGTRFIKLSAAINLADTAASEIVIAADVAAQLEYVNEQEAAKKISSAEANERRLRIISQGLGMGLIGLLGARSDVKDLKARPDGKIIDANALENKPQWDREKITKAEDGYKLKRLTESSHSKLSGEEIEQIKTEAENEVREINLGQKTNEEAPSNKVLAQADSEAEKNDTKKKDGENKSADRDNDEAEKIAALTEAKILVAVANQTDEPLPLLKSQLKIVDDQFEAVTRFDYRPKGENVEVWMIGSEYYVGDWGKYKKFPNLDPKSLGEELEIANKLKVTASKAGFDDIDGFINEGKIKWVVLKNGDLMVMPAVKNGVELSHPVLSKGDDVLAAGEAHIAGNKSTGYYILEFNEHSGHFKPKPSSLEVGRRAFKNFLDIKNEF